MHEIVLLDYNAPSAGAGPMEELCKAVVVMVTPKTTTSVLPLRDDGDANRSPNLPETA